MTDFVKLTKEELMELYEYRKGILDSYHELLIDRNKYLQILDDMENSPNPDKDAMRNPKSNIKYLDKWLRKYKYMVEDMLKTDMKGVHPQIKKPTGRPRGSKQHEQRDIEIIARAVELGWLEGKYGEGKQILNKILEEYPELKTTESVRNILKK